MYRVVKVRFIGQTKANETLYDYFTDLDLKTGDTVVVDTCNGLKTATIESIVVSGKNQAHRWVVCQINVEAFQEKLEELKRKQFIFEQMKARLGQVDLIDHFKKIAETDDEMKKFLDAFSGQRSIE